MKPEHNTRYTLAGEPVLCIITPGGTTLCTSLDKDTCDDYGVRPNGDIYRVVWLDEVQEDGSSVRRHQTDLTIHDLEVVS